MLMKIGMSFLAYQQLQRWILALNGIMYVQKYIDAFKSEIFEMFNAGCQDKSFRMGNGRILEKIKRKYPGRLDIPSKMKNRQAI